MVSNWFALIMLIVTSCLLCVSSFKCYQCRSDLDDNCEDLQDDEYLQECDKEKNSTLETEEGDEFEDDEVMNTEILKKAHSSKIPPKPHCRKVVQYLYFINKSTITTTSRECTKTLSHVREDKCYKENFGSFYLYICECRKQGCNAAGDCKTRLRSILILLCFYVVFPPR